MRNTRAKSVKFSSDKRLIERTTTHRTRQIRTSLNWLSKQNDEI